MRVVKADAAASPVARKDMNVMSAFYAVYALLPMTKKRRFPQKAPMKQATIERNRWVT
ncbi:hypothetical protein ANI02nite_11150 [Acetobacter nitrogenifigens DSM 23921 = NBRC 105050]|uniref:Uncharacterized protein n=1 Tax=Acetobacter nitrogenifigens DSM 23921 = NBRC 105050 TaxID=1120919 RepID=A0A511X8J0_9PROT|nr:hypothetical protein ANI02nite_11150 [Acetobacter nitrogenifigens DSM 23921 = NBRC 105050]